ncbi:MAG: ankyrin repeat domain-containing protein [Parachlamydiales bacterium]
MRKEHLALEALRRGQKYAQLTQGLTQRISGAVLSLSPKEKGVNALDEEGRSPLSKAAFAGDLESVKRLIEEEGADVNLVNSGGFTALHLAAHQGHTEVLGYLLDKGADVKQKTEAGCSALHFAAGNGREEIVSTLLSKGAEVDSPDSEGITPLMYAAVRGHDSTMSKLKDAGADEKRKKGLVDALYLREYAYMEARGDNPLHVAVILDRIEELKELLKDPDSKALLNEYNQKGRTPLHEAAKAGNTAAYELLVKAGANNSPPKQKRALRG